MQRQRFIPSIGKIEKGTYVSDQLCGQPGQFLVLLSGIYFSCFHG